MSTKLVNLPDFLIVMIGKNHGRTGVIEIEESQCISSKYIDKVEQRMIQRLEKIEKELSERLRTLNSTKSILETELINEEGKKCFTEKEEIRTRRKISEIKKKIAEVSEEINFELEHTQHEKNIVGSKFHETKSNYILGVKKSFGKGNRNEY